MRLDLALPHGVYRIEGIEECEIRDRLIGLGFSNGTEIIKLFEASGGDPCAYSVKNTVVALRNRDAAKVIIEGRGAWA